MIITDNNFINFNDVYSSMKTKQENSLRYITYFDILFNTLLEMFTYEGLPDSIPQRMLETILHTHGEVFIANIEGELYATIGSLSGEVDAYGLGTECIAVSPVGEARGERDKNIVYGINNYTATPDSLIYWISHLMGEIDKSVKTNIIYSRLLNIPKVRDEKDKQAFKEIIEKLVDGDINAFVSNNVLDLELGENVGNIFEVSNSDKVDKLQYLSRFADDILKRFYNFYGQSMQTQNKSAQSISDELHGMDSISFILPMEMLKCRQKMCEDINRIFSLDVKVTFSECWNLEYKALINRDLNENGTPDISEDITNDITDIDNIDEKVDNIDDDNVDKKGGEE